MVKPYKLAVCLCVFLAKKNGHDGYLDREGEGGCIMEKWSVVLAQYDAGLVNKVWWRDSMVRQVLVSEAMNAPA